LLEQIDSPLLLEYTYGAAGKPYLKNYPFYFSISHSGNYVLCVLSEQEIGADIQLRTPKVQEALLQRFFSEEEIAYWKQCATEEDKDTFFYRMWCRKEAYGKLTGEGIIKAVGINMLLPEPVVEGTQIVISEYFLENYQIAICKQKLQ